MYGANLSWQPLKKILNSMVSNGIILEIELNERGDKRTKRTYELTQKGENILQYFRKAKDLLPLEEISNFI